VLYLIGKWLSSKLNWDIDFDTIFPIVGLVLKDLFYGLFSPLKIKVTRKDFALDDNGKIKKIYIGLTWIYHGSTANHIIIRDVILNDVADIAFNVSLLCNGESPKRLGDLLCDLNGNNNICSTDIQMEMRSAFPECRFSVEVHYIINNCDLKSKKIRFG
jgi:hypothetical protein